MYLAVLLWANTPNKPQGMPDAWPSEVKELRNSQELPSSSWLLMTFEDYKAYLDHRRDTYNQWYATQDNTSIWADPDANGGEPQ